MTTTWDLLTSSLPEFLRPAMLFLSRCTEASYPTYHLPCSDLVVGMSPTSTHSSWFRDVPKTLTWENNCWNRLLLCSLLYQDKNAASCHTHLLSTRRHWYLSQAHFAFNLWVFKSFCLHFYTDNATSLTVVGWAWAPSDSTAGLPQHPSSQHIWYIWLYPILKTNENY